MDRVTSRVALLATLSIAMLAPPSTERAFAENGIAPGFSVRSLDGKAVRLADFKGKPVVLDFCATWAAPCRTSMPDLSRLQDRYRGQGLVVLGLSIDDDSPNLVRKVADQLGIKFRLAIADERVLDLYGPIRSLPTTIFINRRGEVVRRVVGYIDAETTETYLLELFE